MGLKMQLRKLPQAAIDALAAKIEEDRLTLQEIADFMKLQGYPDITAHVVSRFKRNMKESRAVSHRTLYRQRKAVEEMKRLLFDQHFINLRLQELSKIIVEAELEAKKPPKPSKPQ
jgi:hypothetical protein